MKKSVLLVLFSFLILILIVSFTFALNDTTTSNLDNKNNTSLGSSGSDNFNGVDRAYQCLKDEVAGKTSLGFSESIFTILALGNNDKALSKIESEKKANSDCWPKSSCKIKETSQVLLAYNRIGKNIGGIKTWIEDRKINSKELTWYLEIDIQNHEPSSCTVKYDNSERTINVNSDLTLSGQGGSCLSIGAGGYWLKVNDNCLEKDFEISCQNDFITTLLYQKGFGGTLFVSSDTKSSSGLGSTTESVNSKCLKSGTGNSDRCDYESTLWGALALGKTGEDINQFIPYLNTFSESGKKFFPSSFLYILRGNDDNYNEIVQSQRNNKYWDIVGSPENKFYDTSLGLLSLAGAGATEFSNAQDYLLSVQEDKGCWNNNIANTGFLLYAGWPRSVPKVSGGTTSANCEPSGNYCEGSSSCLDSGGLVLNNFECSNFRNVCCSVNVVEQSCSEKSGIICSDNQECSGRTTSSIDGSCCLESCVNKAVESTCEVGGGSCRASCSDKEESSDESCRFSGDVCCVASSVKEDKKGSSWWIWIVLSFLILLVILGIWKRNKLRLWMHKRKGDMSSSPLQRGPGPRGPPRFGGGGFSRRPPMRRPSGFQRGAPRRNAEFEETMRKLKEI